MCVYGETKNNSKIKENSPEEEVNKMEIRNVSDMEFSIMMAEKSTA